MSNINSCPGQRYYWHELDSLRGLAALAVFFSHLLGTHPIVEQYQGFPRFLWDGAAAVDLFFVLSGFVLYGSSSFSGQDSLLRDYPAFLIKRIFRLYPLLLVSLGIGLLCYAAASPLAQNTDLSDWARSQWARPPSLVDWLKNSALILPGTDAKAINPAIWSLAIEMKISLFLPVLFVLVYRLRLLTLLALMLLLSVAVLGYQRLLPGLLIWCLPFVAGAWLAKYQDTFRQRLAMFSRRAWMAFIALAVILYGNRYTLPQHAQPTLCILLSSVGSVMLVLVAIRHAGVSAGLRHPILRYVGKISYGLYLLHMPLLFLIVSCVPAGTPLPLTAAITLGITVLVAHPLHRWVEQPGIRWGRAWSAWWSARWVSRQPG